jgi:hypothetical protein
MQGLIHNVEGVSSMAYVAVCTRLATAAPTEIGPYFAMLEDAAGHRNPEHWNRYNAELDIDRLDSMYVASRRGRSPAPYLLKCINLNSARPVCRFATGQRRNANGPAPFF